MANCGGYKNSAEWAQKDPDGLIKNIKGNKKAAGLINTSNPSKLKNFMRAVGKDTVDPFGFIGGDIVFSTMFSAAEEAAGKTPLEALDSGVLWFLPKSVINAQKKSLFGYEGFGPGKKFKMKGHTQGFSDQEIQNMQMFYDIDQADQKYFEAKNELDSFETNLKDKPELFTNITSQQIENNRKRLNDTMNKYYGQTEKIVENFRDSNTGLRFTEDGTPFKQEMDDAALNDLFKTTFQNFGTVQNRYAAAQLNKAKEADINRLYAQKEGWFDKMFPNVEGFGERKDGELQLPWGLGPAGDVATSISNPWDRFYARSQLPENTSLPWGVRQGWNSVLGIWNALPHASQEEKEAYARSLGRHDLFEEKTPSTLTAEDFFRVFPEYQQFAGGGIAGIRRPHAIPPKSGPMPQGGGLSSMFNRVRKW